MLRRTYTIILAITLLFAQNFSCPSHLSRSVIGTVDTGAVVNINHFLFPPSLMEKDLSFVVK